MEPSQYEAYEKNKKLDTERKSQVDKIVKNLSIPSNLKEINEVKHIARGFIKHSN